jgi:hypothetical protein
MLDDYVLKLFIIISTAGLSTLSEANAVRSPSRQKVWGAMASPEFCSKGDGRTAHGFVNLLLESESHRLPNLHTYAKFEVAHASVPPKLATPQTGRTWKTGNTSETTLKFRRLKGDTMETAKITKAYTILSVP